MGAQDNALEISDEEFLSNPMLFDDEVELDEDIPESPDKEPGEEESDLEEDITGGELSDEGGEEPEEAIEEELGTPHDTDETDSSSDDEEPDELLSNDEEDGDTEEVDNNEEESEEEEVSDFENFHKTVTAPFKANGKTMQIDSADDAIKLMQMGANYNRKMGALKPQLKVLRMLEQHDLLDESKLSFLIDLNKKDPQAINQLLKDGNIDPMEIDLEAGKYSRSDYSVPESTVVLDDVVSDLEGSEHFGPTLELVTKQWDQASKQHVAEQPNLLRVIHDHMASGVYDLVSTEVEKERMFGRLTGVNDIEAYRAVGDSMNERGVFDHIFPQEGGKRPPSKASSQSIKPKAEDQARKEKRRAASPTKRTAKSKSKSDDFSPLAMSDEEYSKQFDPRFS